MSGKIGPGDTVYLCGTITTTLTVQNSGSAGSPITITGVDATSIIDGNLTGLDLTSKNYITFGGNITFQNQTGVNSRAILIAGSSSELIIQDFIIDGSGTSYFGIILSTASAGNVTIRRGTLKKNTSSSLQFTNWANASAVLTMDNIVVGGSVSDSSHRGLSFSSLSGPVVHISDIDVSYSSSSGADNANFYIVQSNFGTSSYVNDSSFTYAQDGLNLLMIDGSNIVFNRNDFSHASGTTQVLSGTGVAVTSNVTASLHDITFNNNVASYNSNDGFNVSQSGSILYNIYFNKNTSHHNGTLGSINFGDGFTVHGNAYNLYYYYNVAYDNYLTAIAGVDTSSGYIYNMVSARNGTLNHTRSGLFFNNSAANSVTGTGWTIKNTISFDDMPYAIYLSTGSIPITTFDYNTYKLSSSATNFALLNATQNNFSTWQQTYDSHSAVIDPLFTNSDNNDYRLLSNSPAINAGVDVSLTTDFVGNPIQGLPDIGAYEYQPVSSTGSNTSSSTSQPAYLWSAPLPFTVVEKNNVISLVNAGVFKYDAYLSVGVTPRIGSFKIPGANYWQAGSIYEVWWKSWFNDAKILPSEVVKPFTLIFKYDISALEKSLSEKRLALAYSTDAKTWKIIPSILDTKKKQLVIVTKNGGYYMLVSGYPQNTQSVRGVETEEQLTTPESTPTPTIQETTPTQTSKPKHCFLFICW